MAITYECLLQKFGFSPERDPFKSVNATEERNFLPEYFVAPPFFESVWGNSQAPKSCIVFAPTGAGKTAQVIMMQERAASEKNTASRVLTLLYDDFERQGVTSLSNATIEVHLHVLTRIATVGLLKTIGEYSGGSLSFSAAEREEIQYLSKKYLGGASEETLAASLRSIRSPLQKLTDAVESVAFSLPLVAAGLKFLNMEPASATILGLQAAASAAKSAKATLSTSAPDRTEWFDFERVMRLLKVYYNSTYIIIDRVDECSFTTRNSESSYLLISPMVTSLALLNPHDSAWCFKFFLWDAVQNHYAEHGRTDRIENHVLKWSAEQLATMLDRRIDYYSEHRLPSFLSLFEKNEIEGSPIGLKEMLVFFSGGSPRDSIRILQRVFSSYLDILNKNGCSIEECSSKMPIEAVYEGMETFARDRFRELVPSVETRRQMESIHRVCLTSTTLTTSVQKISANAANSKISLWKQSGAVVQIGDIMMNRTGKPNRLYAFSDPRISLCTAGTGAQAFITQK